MIKDVGIYSNNNKDNLLLNGNESPKNINKDKYFKILEKLKKVDLNRYPDTDGDKLREAYSSYAGVSLDNIIIGNGSDEVINLVISKNIQKGDKLLTVTPDFVMYDFYTALNEGNVTKYNLDVDNCFNLEEFIALGKNKDVKIVVFSNPNNPTGFAYSKENIIKILEAFKDKIVLVDEAYYEFNGESVLSLIDEYPNLIVTRTLSKAWGLAALRVGFLISNKDNIRELLKYKTPYNVNTISQEIASIYIKEEVNSLNENLKLIINERERLYTELKKIEESAKSNKGFIKFYKSKANFIFGRAENKEELINAFREEKVTIRSFENNSFRITVGLPEENNKVVDIMKYFDKQNNEIMKE